MNDEAIFAVLDVETTGFSPIAGDRIIEIAVVRVRPDGNIESEYATLLNPSRPVGPSELHGIEQGDVVNAPTFEEVAGDVLDRLEGLVVVGHNIRYDRDFLAAELTAAGVFLPSIPCLCTLKLAHRLHPELPNHRIATCCSAVGVEHAHPHEALEEARVTARLLGYLLEEAQGSGITMADVLDSELRFPKAWPKIVPTGKGMPRHPRKLKLGKAPFLARVAAGRSSVAAESVAPYLDLLDKALEDHSLTEAEASALEQTAEAWGLSVGQVRETHEAYLRSLVAAALADGWVSRTERRDLETVVAMLRLPTAMLESMISEVAENGT